MLSNGFNVQLQRIRHCKSRVAAAEAMKAESASDATLRMPRPPNLVGRPACDHCWSDRLTLQILETADLSSSSILRSRPSGFPSHVAVLSVNTSRGALKLFFKRTRASFISNFNF